LFAAGSDSDGDDWDGGIGIWSIAWSPQGGQLIAGTNGNAVYIYDIESKRCLTKLTNHQDDVNAVVRLFAGTSWHVDLCYTASTCSKFECDVQ
jgi:WD40 repeat protein